ncbi:MAG: Glycosyl transferase family 2 [Candidatus Moranbacteria bacterium GW2011_GWE1_49_15]|nr:MAG: Glycosyl transferase family 2 [Candidatus Moranbacteria bacterium GW2011_GWE2_47_10]KKW07344.1 MAG: Glycosyl transferase family 2 [Candidatus Moranbacteria bacterium GW2011_GWE1_49_15]HBP00829.1 glycosyltransferase family 2 protein [Candidatus Moranbacteria bacterium]
MDKNIDPKVFAIVLNYNGQDCLVPCLDSLYQSDYANLEIVVVDNASKDGSLENAREKFPKIHFIKNSENVGFACGNNVAIRFALEKMADYVFLLNNDATVQIDTISNLVKEAEENPDLGMASPIILSADGNGVWFAGGKISWREMKTVHVPGSQEQNPYETEYVSGCAALIRKDVFGEIGLFDENFFLYYEDADLSCRATRAGFKLRMIPEALAHHAEKSEMVNKKKLYWLVLSGLIFFKKNSRGFNRIWSVFYLFLRKTKNRLNMLTSTSDKDVMIRKAFHDYKIFLRQNL